MPEPHSLAADGTRVTNLTEHRQKRMEGKMDVEWAGPQMCCRGPKGLLGNEIPISLWLCRCSSPSPDFMLHYVPVWHISHTHICPQWREIIVNWGERWEFQHLTARASTRGLARPLRELLDIWTNVVSSWKMDIYVYYLGYTLKQSSNSCIAFGYVLPDDL